MPKPYPREFREDVIRVARGREPDVRLSQVAADFGISESCLANRLRAADVEDGIKPGTTAADNVELKTAKRRIRLLEQENEVLRRATAHLSQANPPVIDSSLSVRKYRLSRGFGKQRVKPSQPLLARLKFR